MRSVIPMSVRSIQCVPRRSLHQYAIRRSQQETTNNGPSVAATAAAAASNAASSVATPSVSFNSAATSAAVSHALNKSEAELIKNASMNARYHRRARLWLVAFVTGCSAIVTAYRAHEQGSRQHAEEISLRQQVGDAKLKLDSMRSKEVERRKHITEAIKNKSPNMAALIAAAGNNTTAAVATAGAASVPSNATALPSAPATSTASTTILPPIVPTNFLDAVVLDVARAVHETPNDDRVKLASSLAQMTPATGGAGTTDNAPKQTRKAILM
jgi:hypothetical protein